MTQKANKKLVVVADDFGFCESVNKGVLKSYKEGIVTEVSLMVNSKATDDAVYEAKKSKIADVGLHMELVGFDQLGRALHKSDYKELFQEKSYSEIEQLARDEIEKFEKCFDKKPSHITTHIGIHGNFKLLKFIVAYAGENNIPVRLPNTDLEGNLDESNYAAEVILKRENIKTTDHLFIHVRGSDSKQIKKKFLKDLDEVSPNETAEILLHPGFFDLELLKMSSLNYERGRDLCIAISENFKEKINNLGFDIVNFSKI